LLEVAYSLAARLLADVADEDVPPGIEVNGQSCPLTWVDLGDLVDRVKLGSFLIECTV
jgi:hypothetical protein